MARVGRSKRTSRRGGRLIQPRFGCTVPNSTAPVSMPGSATSQEDSAKITTMAIVAVAPVIANWCVIHPDTSPRGNANRHDWFRGVLGAVPSASILCAETRHVSRTALASVSTYPAPTLSIAYYQGGTPAGQAVLELAGTCLPFIAGVRSFVWGRDHLPVTTTLVCHARDLGNPDVEYLLHTD